MSGSDEGRSAAPGTILLGCEQVLGRHGAAFACSVLCPAWTAPRAGYRCFSGVSVPCRVGLRSGLGRIHTTGVEELPTGEQFENKTSAHIKETCGQ